MLCCSQPVGDPPGKVRGKLFLCLPKKGKAIPKRHFAIRCQNEGGALGFLQQLNKEGSTVILITHDNGIAATARRIVRIADGRIIEDHPQEVNWY